MGRDEWGGDTDTVGFQIMYVTLNLNIHLQLVNFEEAFYKSTLKIVFISSLEH